LRQQALELFDAGDPLVEIAAGYELAVEDVGAGVA
jgi:hypothetical protein